MRLTPVGDFTRYWRHQRFPDLCLLNARFTSHRYELHTHPTYVVALITQGCERLHIDHRKATAPVGTVLVVHPEECHDGEAGAADGWAYRTLYPSVSLMSAVAHELGRQGPPVFAQRLIQDAALAGTIATAHRMAEDDDADDAEAAMLLALRRLIADHADRDHGPEPIEPSGSEQRLASYVDAIDVRDKLDLQRLADITGVTRFQVIRDFKRTTGLTPGGYLRNRRIRLASRLLQDGATIVEAALAAGFSDQSHLSRVCRGTLGITPAMLRHAYRSG